MIQEQYHEHYHNISQYTTIYHTIPQYTTIYHNIPCGTILQYIMYIPRFWVVHSSSFWQCCHAIYQGTNYKGQLNNLLHKLLRRHSVAQKRWWCLFFLVVVFFMRQLHESRLTWPQLLSLGWPCILRYKRTHGRLFARQGIMTACVSGVEQQGSKEIGNIFCGVKKWVPACPHTCSTFLEEQNITFIWSLEGWRTTGVTALVGFELSVESPLRLCIIGWAWLNCCQELLS